MEGHFYPDQMLINEAIGRKDGSIIERIVRSDGQEARTEVHVIESFVKNRLKLTKIALKLHTGRTHQIRVHMKWAGHPIPWGRFVRGQSNIDIAASTAL